MTKFKAFISLCKERDWLEEMAAQGWMLTDITLGLFYHFKACEPAQKVFEIERFGGLGTPDKHTLTARSAAFELASEFGWEVVAHDEDLNYYFAKDKAGDESDEFYDDDGLRREKAEKFRQHIEEYTIMFWVVGLIMLVSNVLNARWEQTRLAIPLISNLCVCVVLLMTLLYVFWGRMIYRELCMSRQQWEEYKHYSFKMSFRKTDKLLAFLQKQDERGLALSDYGNGKYRFVETAKHWCYTTDTKSQFKKRLKSHGETYHEEQKDWYGQGMRWYEQSIEEAKHLGLEPVCVVQGDVLVYRSAQPMQLNEQTDVGMGFLVRWKRALLWFVACGAVGLLLGFLTGILCGYFLP